MICKRVRFGLFKVIIRNNNCIDRFWRSSVSKVRVRIQKRSEKDLFSGTRMSRKVRAGAAAVMSFEALLFGAGTRTSNVGLGRRRFLSAATG